MRHICVLRNYYGDRQQPFGSTRVRRGEFTPLERVLIRSADVVSAVPDHDGLGHFHNVGCPVVVVKTQRPGGMLKEGVVQEFLFPGSLDDLQRELNGGAA